MLFRSTGFVRGLWSSITREIDKFKRSAGFPDLILEPIKRDNQEAKAQRILQTLQPWYVSDDLRFLADLDEYCPGVTHALEKELSEFPHGKHDDILDTISDAFQGRKYVGIVRERFDHEDILSVMKKAQMEYFRRGPEGFASGTDTPGSVGYEL